MGVQRVGRPFGGEPAQAQIRAQAGRIAAWKRELLLSCQTNVCVTDGVALAVELFSRKDLAHDDLWLIARGLLAAQNVPITEESVMGATLNYLETTFLRRAWMKEK